VKDGSYRICGAAWGGPVAKVEVTIDSRAWKPATIDPAYSAPYAWKLWTIDWPNPPSGEHSITSRAIDQGGIVQAAPTDPSIARKKTYGRASAGDAEGPHLVTGSAPTWAWRPGRPT
jgi:hypothetical protein